MARVHPGNPPFRIPDDRSNFDHERTQTYAKVPRGRGGGGRGGGRGRGDFCCFRCGQPGHFIRDCPLPGYSYHDYRRDCRAAQTSSEPPELFPKELPQKGFEVIMLEQKIETKETELQLRDQEIESLKSRLKDATSELSSSEEKNREMLLKMNEVEKDLKGCKTKLATEISANKEITLKWSRLNNQFSETKSELCEKIKELEEASLTADADNMMLKVEADQWRKAAKALTYVLVGGADICSKTIELDPIVSYYNNRAAKRMALGKIRKALDDCRIVTRLDPGFLKVCLTAGNCHLVLGELDEARKNYKMCLDSVMICLDRRLTIEVSDGLQNVEKVVSCINQSDDLLQQKSIESATKALEVITEALSISRYSERLLEMKGEVLFMLLKYEEAVQMCEQTLVIAEKNCATSADCNDMSDDDRKKPLKLWRWSLMSRCYFRMAKFDLALAFIEKYELLGPSETKTKGPLYASAATIRELLNYKNAGNEAYKGGKYREALKHYSNAITRSIESRSFTAICLCNRAAAHQALGEVTDAIADCNLAIALDGDYMKAISRRANLLEKIRDYEHASLDFKRLISLLEKSSETKRLEDLAVARQRLSAVKRNMKLRTSLNLYLILGLKGSASGSDIKKAYHKAALKHHPDKAGKFLARSESGADGHIWKEIFTTIHRDADKLFKIIGEAYTLLSDANKRFEYNLQEEMKDDFDW
ncbi:uncharacterized protein [Rutidosis leptorrhynchoides]|uniref:uncharacterized protein n=1 Tax=Rutidosis leptorrhynchoides TaxID=125765 RepID=UPI003A99A0EA